MRPRLMLVGLVLLVGLLRTAMLWAEEKETCDGPYKGKKVSSEELAIMLEHHKRWREQEPHGQRANLCGANLEEANLVGVKLQEATLVSANLQNAILGGANLQNAILGGANLQKAFLVRANLQEAVLWSANLQAAALGGANLQAADLSEANLQAAVFTNVDLTEADYAPSSTPAKGFLGGIRGLSTVWFRPGQQSGLVLLRATLKEVGLRTLEREATYALKHTERCYNWPAFCPPRFQEPGNKTAPGLFATLEGLFHFFFFERTCAYGLKPGRPLLILLGLIPVFACGYGLALWTANRRAGIWVTYSAERTYKRRDTKREWQTRVQQGIWIPYSVDRRDKRRATKREWRALVTHRPQKTPQNAPTEASRQSTGNQGLSVYLASLLCRLRVIPRDQGGYLPSAPQVKPWLRTWWRTGQLALYFSLLSAFHLGWRELNVGTWITRMQWRNYTLSATGWVRGVSGVQSLLSVYLLALWALTDFGRPFE